MTPSLPGLLQYVQDPLNPGQYIPENDPRYAVVLQWMSAQKQDSMIRANALKQFNGAFSDWQTNARQADIYSLTRPPLPAIPNVESDAVISEPDGSYAIKTTFAPVTT